MEFYAITSNIAGGVQLCDISENRHFAKIKIVQESISVTLQRAQVTRYSTANPQCRHLDRTVVPIASTPVNLCEEFTVGVEDKAAGMQFWLHALRKLVRSQIITSQTSTEYMLMFTHHALLAKSFTFPVLVLVLKWHDSNGKFYCHR